MAVRVGKYLHLDMARVKQGALQQQVATAKTRQRFRACALERGQQLRPIGHQPHAAPAPTGHRLHHQRQADALRLAGERVVVLRRAVVAGQAGHAARQRELLGG